MINKDSCLLEKYCLWYLILYWFNRGRKLIPQYWLLRLRKLKLGKAKWWVFFHNKLEIINSNSMFKAKFKELDFINNEYKYLSFHNQMIFHTFIPQSPPLVITSLLPFIIPVNTPLLCASTSNNKYTILLQ